MTSRTTNLLRVLITIGTLVAACSDPNSVDDDDHDGANVTDDDGAGGDERDSGLVCVVHKSDVDICAGITLSDSEWVCAPIDDLGACQSRFESSRSAAVGCSFRTTYGSHKIVEGPCGAALDEVNGGGAGTTGPTTTTTVGAGAGSTGPATTTTVGAGGGTTGPATTTTTTVGAGGGGGGSGICNSGLTTNDSATDVCLSNSCCASVNACANDTVCLGCLTGAGSSCDTNALYLSFVSCSGTLCPDDVCGSGISYVESSGDPAFDCNACVGGNCCAHAQECTQQGTPAEIAACLDCVNDANGATCSAHGSVVRSAAQALLQCEATYCAMECL